MHPKRLFKVLIKVLLGLFFAGLLILGIPKLVTLLFARSRSFSASEVPPAQVAIVFGAGLNRDGSPTPVLRDRVATAANLYFAGKVQKLLVSGDNRFVYYNEPGAMLKYAVQLGVPEADIVQDFAGRSTYDTCYRAKHIFGVSNAILVTQDYHLPRALFLCNQLGVNASGVSADLRQYSRGPYFYWVLREVPATLAAVWDIAVAHPVPVLGIPEPIFPAG
jgi:SanA protein